MGAIYAVEHLIKLGHKNIGFITIKSGVHPSIAERLDGYRTALIKNNLSYNKDLVFDCQTQTFLGGYEKAKEALQKNKKMTALFCVNDEVAAGVLRAAHEVGRDVPKNLSVVGFDNITMSNYTDPPLTTISVAKEYMGKLAVSRILEAIDNKEKLAQVREVPVQLVYRNSTDKPGN